MSLNNLSLDLSDPRFDRLRNHILEEKTRYSHIRTFSSYSKDQVLILRLAIFAPEHLSTYLEEFPKLDMVQFFGEWRKQACLSFIASFDHFPHTNKSLLRTFGYPTRAIYERGRVNAKKLTMESKNAKRVETKLLETFLPESLAMYTKKVESETDDLQSELIHPVSLFIDQFLQEKWFLDANKWDTSSNHSQIDLDDVKELLCEKLNPSSIDSSPSSLIIKKKTYSPDLILNDEKSSEDIFVELKVLNHHCSHFFPLVHLNQLFRYSSASTACILVIYHSPEIEEQQMLDRMTFLAKTCDFTVMEMLTNLTDWLGSIKQLLEQETTEKERIKKALMNYYSFNIQVSNDNLNIHETILIDSLLQSYTSIQSSFSIGYLNKVVRMAKKTISKLEEHPSHSKIRFVNLQTSPLSHLIDSTEDLFLYRIGVLLFPKKNTSP